MMHCRVPVPSNSLQRWGAELETWNVRGREIRTLPPAVLDPKRNVSIRLKTVVQKELLPKACKARVTQQVFGLGHVLVLFYFVIT